MKRERQLFVACETYISRHGVCSGRFTYKGETFTCDCECHQAPASTPEVEADGFVVDRQREAAKFGAEV